MSMTCISHICISVLGSSYKACMSASFWIVLHKHAYRPELCLSILSYAIIIYMDASCIAVSTKVHDRIARVAIAGLSSFVDFHAFCLQPLLEIVEFPLPMPLQQCAAAGAWAPASCPSDDADTVASAATRAAVRIVFMANLGVLKV